jgi:ComEC/Rec2-related protein
MKRPLIPVALLYVSGLLAAEFIAAPLGWLLIVSLGVGGLSLVWAKARPALLPPLLALCGWTNLTSHQAVVSPHDLRTIIGTNVMFVTLRGTLVETPFQRIYQHEPDPSWRTLAQLDVAALQFENKNWQPAFGRVAVSTPGILPNSFFAGQTVEIPGVLRQPKGALADGLFDYRTYLSRLGIYYQLLAASSNDWKNLSRATHPAPPLADRFSAWAKKTLALGLPGVPKDEPLELLWTMTLGWKTALNGEVAEPFMRSGTMHIFAISGLHIALISGILVSLLRVLKVPRAGCGLMVIPLIWVYTGVTGWQASAIRSTVMMTVIIAGWSLRRPSDLLNSLAAAAFIILIWYPQQLFQASFQLSFFVVLSLALFAPVLEQIRKRWLQTDPLLPIDLLPRWQRWLGKPLHFLTASFTTSLAAWLGSMPLVAYYFHLFTPVSLLANLIVVPLSSAALASNLASLIVGGWFPACAELFNHSAWFWMWLMIRVSQWSADFPGGCFNVAAPSLITFALFYTALISVMAGWLTRPRLRVWVGSSLALLALGWIIQWQHDGGLTRLTVLPLRDGNAIFLDAPGAKQDWLIDCGNESAAQFITKPFLRAQGVNRLPHFVLTHGDLRQVGGAEFIRTNFPPQNLYTSAVRFRSPAYRKFLDHSSAAGLLEHHVKRGDQIGPCTVLHPEVEDHFPQADDNTIILRAVINRKRILLLSDLGRPGQKALLERTPDLRADIIIAGLPSQTEPLADALLDAIQPKLVIVTDAEFPTTARGSRALRERLAERAIPVLYTRETGSVTFTFSSRGWQWHTASGSKMPANAR